MRRTRWFLLERQTCGTYALFGLLVSQELLRFSRVTVGFVRVENCPLKDLKMPSERMNTGSRGHSQPPLSFVFAVSSVVITTIIYHRVVHKQVVDEDRTEGVNTRDTMQKPETQTDSPPDFGGS